MSAVGNTVRAAQFKANNPRASTSDVMGGARNLGAIGLELREDKSFTFMQQGKAEKGTLSFDEQRNEVQLNLDPEVIDPANPAADMAPPKPQVCVAYLDTGSRELELFQEDRAGYEFLKQAGAKNARGTVLRKG